MDDWQSRIQLALAHLTQPGCIRKKKISNKLTSLSFSALSNYQFYVPRQIIKSCLGPLIVYAPNNETKMANVISWSLSTKMYFKATIASLVISD